MIFLAASLLYLVVMNIITYRAFAADKQFAIDKAPRTPEATLLGHARRGGWIGAKLAQQKLRHKSYKQPFGSQLNTIGAVQGACLMTFGVVMGFLVLASAGATAEQGIRTAEAAARAAQPARAPVAISLRAPAARP